MKANSQPLTCDCGEVIQRDFAAQNLETVICPRCKQKVSKGETWIMPLGDTNMKELEGVEDEEKFFKSRKLRNGY